MATETLRPDGTITSQGGFTNVGAATFHGATSDDSDASYVEVANPAAAVMLSTGTFTLTAGARTKSARIRARARAHDTNPAQSDIVLAYLYYGGTQIAGAQLNQDVGTTFTDVAGPYAATPVLTQTEIDDLRIAFTSQVIVAGVRVAELYLDVIEVTQPTTAVTYPTGAPTITDTNRPTFLWTYTQTDMVDGGVQTFYEVKVFTDAQIAAGGFDSATSTPYWTSGIAIGSAVSQLSGALATGDTYGVYVRTAQTINSAAHWSAFDSETFTIDVDTADIEDVTPTADNTNGRILVAVDRVAASEAWDFVEVQRSVDAGVTWEYLRGGEYVPPATSTLWSTGDASNFDIYDYELGNGVSVLYRARATLVLSELPITGEWVESSPAVSWTSLLTFIKAPNTPALNAGFNVDNIPTMTRSIAQGIHNVLARREPIVIGDVRRSVTGDVAIITLDDDEADDLLALVELASPLLIQAPPPNRFGSRYVAIGEVVEARGARYFAEPTNVWSMPFVEVVAPSDPEAGAPG